MWLLLAILPLSQGVDLSWFVDTDGSYSLLVDSAPAFSSPSFSAAPPLLCVGGAYEPLLQVGQASVSGVDPLGAWTGTAVTLHSAKSATPVVHTFRAYAGSPTILTSTAAFPAGVPGGGGNCGVSAAVRTSFPQFNTSDAMAPTLGFFSWRDSVLSQLPAAVGLGNLGQNTLDSGPVVAFFNGRPGVPHPGIVWSTLTSHKVVTQATVGAQGTTPAPLTALWSSERAEQVACLSDLCAGDQVADGAYAPLRVEGYGFSALGGDAPAGSACANGATFPVAQLRFAWSEKLIDNFVGNASNPLPDGSYAVMGDDGWVVAAAGVPGTVPLFAVRKAYNESHVDWAAVASPAGRSWAAENGYTTEFVMGYVFTAEPAPCAAGSGGTYTAGLSALVPDIPAGWSYSHIFSVADGGPTAAVYAWGAAIQTYLGTTRLPSVTLTDIGYYTDDGAYYYVWEAFNIPARPWPAEVGLQLVKEDLYAKGIPVAYMQLDDWWYTGKFYFGNVKSITDWHASNASRLFPNGLPAFADTLDLPLQLYTPFWADDFQTPYNTTESTSFKGTKLVTPADSYAFFSDLFDLGNAQTNNRMKAYEIDFLDDNFRGSSSMFETVSSADAWYGGMARAALERGIAIQYCLPSATDMLQSLLYPAVVQARASADYVQKEQNPYSLGGSSLLMGATRVAPSKDTLWTASPQPGTMSDTEHDGLSYTTQPHVALDAVLATLSLGPVGISDGLGQADAGLISQAFRCANDSTLLRPSRPLSWVNSVLLNKTFRVPAADVRATHAAVRTSPSQAAATHNSHVLLAWQTAGAVALGPGDLYPAPADPDAPLAARLHVLAPGAPQQAGCEEGAPAVPACVTLVQPGDAVVVPASGTSAPANFTLLAVYEPFENGAWLLGELTKFVHVSPQRFDWAGVGGAGKSGLRAGVRGAAGEVVRVTSVDANGTVHVADIAIPQGGVAVADL